MSLSTRMILVLTCVGLLSGGFLAGVGLWTKDKIAYNVQQEIEQAIKTVVPGTAVSEKLHEERDFTLYAGKKEDGTLAGYAVYASGAGFQDTITIMFGTDIELKKLIRLTILKQTETPGLGANIEREDLFLKFWENRDIQASLILHKPAASSPNELTPTEINTITGATISSESVLNLVNLSLEKLKEKIESLQLERQ
ncbi:MAG: FMN-binding protein [Candidatus Aminicenantes bacterium]|nr:FMN-binding protein [Candidatus Aminicenantes bacterium]